MLAFFRTMQSEGRLETRDRVHSIGEQVCDYADLDGDGYNPFRACKKQLAPNVSTPRPGVTDPQDVVRLFRLIMPPDLATWSVMPFGSMHLLFLARHD
ncbi:hypothetical protein QA640_40235 [Bradyrhizobium sp. CB82]|uniref:hypothetical protein n=1 Tax=Bradyrhizobium sp. CB82 TaxID=3039159 RepID=UPI0024B19E8B|nr:hypothetical protein [Bradyrhizobium sp. CB82]WFU40344.1 hypothetical protein QA640_40235 [Bradyrhizobium sp. CB82]